MENKPFLSRLKGWFQPGSAGSSADVLDAPNPSNANDASESSTRARTIDQWSGAKKADAPPSHERSADSRSKDNVQLGSLTPGQNRLEKLQDGYLQVIELVDTIRKHQDRQDERAVEFSTSLSKMASTLAEIEKGNHQQVDQLGNIAEELRAGNKRGDHWQEVLAEFPKTAQAQREALMSVTRQMEAVGDRDDKMTGSLDSLREAVTALGDATTASSVAVKNLQMTAIEDSERTADLLEAQNKRFTMLFALTVTVTLTLVALVTGVLAYTRGG
jgi:chromosome segregation ATPase